MIQEKITRPPLLYEIIKKGTAPIRMQYLAILSR